MSVGPLDFNISEPHTTLRVDAMYFRAASEQNDLAHRGQSEITRALTAVQELQNRIDALGSPPDYDAFEPLAIQL